jgi:hypothetical protein
VDANLYFNAGIDLDPNVYTNGNLHFNGDVHANGHLFANGDVYAYTWGANQFAKRQRQRWNL